jgi:hypothetical protein
VVSFETERGHDFVYLNNNDGSGQILSNFSSVVITAVGIVTTTHPGGSATVTVTSGSGTIATTTNSDGSTVETRNNAGSTKNQRSFENNIEVYVTKIIPNAVGANAGAVTTLVDRTVSFDGGITIQDQQVETTVTQSDKSSVTTVINFSEGANGIETYTMVATVSAPKADKSTATITTTSVRDASGSVIFLLPRSSTTSADGTVTDLHPDGSTSATSADGFIRTFTSKVENSAETNADAVTTRANTQFYGPLARNSILATIITEANGTTSTTTEIFVGSTMVRTVTVVNFDSATGSTTSKETVSYNKDDGTSDGTPEVVTTTVTDAAGIARAVKGNFVTVTSANGQVITTVETLKDANGQTTGSITNTTISANLNSTGPRTATTKIINKDAAGTIKFSVLTATVSVFTFDGLPTSTTTVTTTDASGAVLSKIITAVTVVIRGPFGVGTISTTTSPDGLTIVTRTGIPGGADFFKPPPFNEDSYERIASKIVQNAAGANAGAVTTEGTRTFSYDGIQQGTTEPQTTVTQTDGSRKTTRIRPEFADSSSNNTVTTVTEVSAPGADKSFTTTTTLSREDGSSGTVTVDYFETVVTNAKGVRTIIKANGVTQRRSSSADGNTYADIRTIGNAPGTNANAVTTKSSITAFTGYSVTNFDATTVTESDGSSLTTTTRIDGTGAAIITFTGVDGSTRVTNEDIVTTTSADGKTTGVIETLVSSINQRAEFLMRTDTVSVDQSTTANKVVSLKGKTENITNDLLAMTVTVPSDKVTVTMTTNSDGSTVVTRGPIFTSYNAVILQGNIDVIVTKNIPNAVGANAGAVTTLVARTLSYDGGITTQDQPVETTVTQSDKSSVTTSTSIVQLQTRTTVTTVSAPKADKSTATTIVESTILESGLQSVLSTKSATTSADGTRTDIIDDVSRTATSADGFTRTSTTRVTNEGGTNADAVTTRAETTFYGPAGNSNSYTAKNKLMETIITEANGTTLTTSQTQTNAVTIKTVTVVNFDSATGSTTSKETVSNTTMNPDGTSDSAPDVVTTTVTDASGGAKIVKGNIVTEISANGLVITTVTSLGGASAPSITNATVTVTNSDGSKTVTTKITNKDSGGTVTSTVLTTTVSVPTFDGFPTTTTTTTFKSGSGTVIGENITATKVVRGPFGVGTISTTTSPDGSNIVTRTGIPGAEGFLILPPFNKKAYEVIKFRIVPNAAGANAGAVTTEGTRSFSNYDGTSLSTPLPETTVTQTDGSRRITKSRTETAGGDDYTITTVIQVSAPSADKSFTTTTTESRKKESSGVVTVGTIIAVTNAKGARTTTNSDSSTQISADGNTLTSTKKITNAQGTNANAVTTESNIMTFPAGVTTAQNSVTTTVTESDGSSVTTGTIDGNFGKSLKVTRVSKFDTLTNSTTAEEMVTALQTNLITVTKTVTRVDGEIKVTKGNIVTTTSADGKTIRTTETLVSSKTPGAALVITKHAVAVPVLGAVFSVLTTKDTTTVTVNGFRYSSGYGYSGDLSDGSGEHAGSPLQGKIVSSLRFTSNSLVAAGGWKLCYAFTNSPTRNPTVITRSPISLAPNINGSLSPTSVPSRAPTQNTSAPVTSTPLTIAPTLTTGAPSASPTGNCVCMCVYTCECVCACMCECLYLCPLVIVCVAHSCSNACGPAAAIDAMRSFFKDLRLCSLTSLTVRRAPFLSQTPKTSTPQPWYVRIFYYLLGLLCNKT